MLTNLIFVGENLIKAHGYLEVPDASVGGHWSMDMRVRELEGGEKRKLKKDKCCSKK